MVGGRALTLLVCMLAIAVAVVAASQPVYRSGVEMVSLNVSVTDGDREFIGGLAADDFSVYENGERRDVTFFGADAVPVDVVLLLDVSGSMREKIGFIARAATGFIRTLRPRDRASVAGFADRVEVIDSATTDRRELERTVVKARTQGMTALYDALYVTAKDVIKKRQGSDEIRRQAFVVLSDGADTSSLTGEDDALAVVRRAGVTVYAISPQPRFSAARYKFPAFKRALEAEQLLTTLATDTGGRAFFLEELTDLTDVYEQIGAELFQQYTLAYKFENKPGWGTKFRQLLVRVVTRPDAIVRTRRGYDPPSLR